MREAAVTVARTLLASSDGEITEIWVRPFAPDEQTHDDGMQQQVAREFASGFDTAVAEIGAEYGPPTRAGEDDDGGLPIGGVFRFAVWSVKNREMWLAAAHEDRELPFVLLLGFAP